MKKLNRQEITAIAHSIQDKINASETTNLESIDSITKRFKKTDEYKHLIKLAKNPSVIEVLSMKGQGLYLTHKIGVLLRTEIGRSGYKVTQSWDRDNNKYVYTYIPKTTNLIDKIKRDITLEQLMSDDLEMLIDKITKKYI